jgi:CelD/BcsL family acetyltransferase involved in cellulose biosynthesis
LIHFRAHVASRFGDLPDGVHALLARAPAFDCSLPWLEAMARHTLAPGERLELVWVEESPGRALAVLPLVRGDAGAAPLRGRSLRALANYYTGCFRPIVAAGDPERAGQALADALASGPADWEALDLNPMDPDDPAFAALERGMRARGAYVQRYFRFGNWYLDVAGRDADAYLASLPSRVQNTLRRKGKKLAQRGDARFEILTTPAGLDGALDAWEAVYAKSWRTQAEPYPTFIRDVAHAFAEHGWLRFGLLWLGDTLAAAQLWFVHGGTASIFKLAYDPDHAELSAGSLLTAHLMRHALDVDRVRVVDYLSGDDDYKRDWMSARRERWGLRAYRLASVAGLAGAARSLAGGLARRGLRVVRGTGTGRAS